MSESSTKVFSDKENTQHLTASNIRDKPSEMLSEIEIESNSLPNEVSRMICNESST